MALIREFEERLYALFSEGVLYGTTHAYTGQEAVAVGVVGQLDRARDVITSNHRGHGHYLAYCDDVEGLLAELMGRASGTCHGWGGSQHLRRGNFLSNGVLGSMLPVGVGMALAEKRKRSGAIVCNFLGDGTLGEGVLYESLNMAGLWRLPVLFCVENNRYQQAVAVERAVAGDIAARGAAFGLETVVLDGNDLEAIDATLGAIVPRVRDEHLPHWVVLETYRMAGHSKSDDACYRSRAEEARWRERDPLAAAERKLPAGTRAAVLAEARARVDAALERARAAARPRLEDAPPR